LDGALKKIGWFFMDGWMDGALVSGRGHMGPIWWEFRQKEKINSNNSNKK
jgi:hypothetical protein